MGKPAFGFPITFHPPVISTALRHCVVSPETDPAWPVASVVRLAYRFAAALFPVAPSPSHPGAYIVVGWSMPAAFPAVSDSAGSGAFVCLWHRLLHPLVRTVDAGSDTR